MNFEHHYGRAVVMFGIPYQYTQSRVLRARLEYLEAKFQVKHSDFLTFDAMRQTARYGSCDSKQEDYGVMIFADKRYGRYDKRSKLPQWIQKHFSQEHLNLTTDIAIDVTKRFLKAMAQEVSVEESSTKEEEMRRRMIAVLNGVVQMALRRRRRRQQQRRRDRRGSGTSEFSHDMANKIT